MASIWDALRADMLLSLMLESSETFYVGRETPVGVATFPDGSFALSFVQKHFDSIKESLQCFGGCSLLVEGESSGGLLVGIIDPQHEALLDSQEKLVSLRDTIQNSVAPLLADNDTDLPRKIFDSFVKASREAFRSANGLESHAERESGGSSLGRGSILPTIPTSDGVSAADNLRMMIALQSLEMNSPPQKKEVSASEAALQSALDTLHEDVEDLYVMSGMDKLSSSKDVQSFSSTLYSSLLVLSAGVGSRLAELARRREAAADKEPADLTLHGEVMLGDSCAFFAAVNSHQRRFLSNPGAMGPRFSFPISVFDQCMAFAANGNATQSSHLVQTSEPSAITKQFLDLRDRVEFAHMVKDGVEDGDGAAPRTISYFASLRI